ncbi:succinate dehydrogenase, cytochrome b556 subunit [Wenzhouxiangella marina]|uniref:Succinate dehydrogenase cytochrome b556 subunit n=1 Tax=Wenzhouxiangella marina TaxID=1579979 RepID=A0A0K0XWY1_9GAMM|nr:succinate dehydrogenase, cytochrome b556 subunit [Wenzhouxiangella marina]AKS42180.1 Succinate dehydrogenase/fumarate reductase, cytochrome b subunit [Wenzhouxiangella marina]MBB6086048.1 succinate dehydrogenase / fumarate reductase cytochrome b subunit [Wenzhouxiangella marina]
MATDNRPLSPHLQIYRLPLTARVSISHRATGIVLSIGMIAVVLWTLALAAGPEHYERFMAMATHPVVMIGMIIWSFALYFHLLNGIRHLIWDAGRMLDLKSVYATSWMVVIGAVLLTVLTWGVLA